DPVPAVPSSDDDADLGCNGDQGRLRNRERAESGDEQASRPDGRSLLPGACRQTRDRRSRHARRCRQRRRIPADDPKLSLEVASLYREAPRTEEQRTSALEFHDVFKIFRSGPVETVALRGLDLRIEQGEFVAIL